MKHEITVNAKPTHQFLADVKGKPDPKRPDELLALPTRGAGPNITWRLK